MTIEALQKKAAQIRVDSLTAISRAGSGHSGSSMSCVEILVSLYYGKISEKYVAKLSPRKPQWEEQDYIILSKGQAVPTQYAILADLGFFDKSELDFLRKVNSPLQGYPNVKVPGITVPITSHGCGLSIATGLAMALKMDRQPNKVFSILGDGELQEGQVWEAAMCAAHYKLDNLIAFIDNDDLQMDGPVRSIMDVMPIQDKFEAFGWKVIHVWHGHDFDEILDAIAKAFTTNRHPVCIWCHTVKGKGIEFAEGKPYYHDVPLSEAELAEVKKKLDPVCANNLKMFGNEGFNPGWGKN
ncbi:MAG: transketolase [Candidatus Gracilibacteria bacterium]